MYWLVLICSGVFEAVWATALDKSAGFTKPLPIVVFFLASIVSLGGLCFVLKQLPVGTAYAVWTAVGACATICYSVASGDEKLSLVKALLLAGLVGCVIGLKLVSEPGTE